MVVGSDRCEVVRASLFGLGWRLLAGFDLGRQLDDEGGTAHVLHRDAEDFLRRGDRFEHEQEECFDVAQNVLGRSCGVFAAEI